MTTNKENNFEFLGVLQSILETLDFELRAVQKELEDILYLNQEEKSRIMKRSDFVQEMISNFFQQYEHQVQGEETSQIDDHQEFSESTFQTEETLE
eukprot:gene8741-689_t